MVLIRKRDALGMETAKYSQTLSSSTPESILSSVCDSASYSLLLLLLFAIVDLL